MQIIFTPKAKEQLVFWENSGNKAMLKKIVQLIKAICENPYHGIGKPEALKYELTGFWSRRIDDKHRIVYQIEGDTLKIFSVKGHY